MTVVLIKVWEPLICGDHGESYFPPQISWTKGVFDSVGHYKLKREIMNKDWKELAISRYKCMSPDILISIGGDWNNIAHIYNSLAIIEEIKKETEIGKYFVEVERRYLTSLKTEWLNKIMSS